MRDIKSRLLAAVMAAGVWSAGVPASVVQAAERWPEVVVMKEMEVVIVADGAVINGLPMRVFELKTDRSVAEIEAFYQSTWPNAVARTTTAMTSSNKEWTVLSHREGDYLTTIQLLSVEETGQTYGLLTMSPFFSDALSAPSTSVPMPRGSELISDIAAKDLGKESRTITIRNQMSLQGNLDYYRNYFAARGWTETFPDLEFPDGQQPTALMMNKGDDELNLAGSEHGGYSWIHLVTVKK